jgi:predicted amidohydrolase YtcJ
MRFSERLRRFVSVRFTLLVAFVMVAGVIPARAKGPVLGPITRIFIGNIRTMVGDHTAHAVGVDGRGLIVAVGSESEVRKAARPDVETIRLAPGQTLMPGFIDAHLHLDLLMMEKSGQAELVGPCLPGSYAAGDTKDCKNYIMDTLVNLKKKLAAHDPNGKTFVVGLNLDPSRQPYSTDTSSEKFKQSPAEYIEEVVSKDRPILLIDQSGHFGYVNHAAFRALKACGDSCQDQWPPELTDGAEWAILPSPECKDKPKGEIKCYSGLLYEYKGYQPFFKVIREDVHDPVTAMSTGGKAALKALESLRTAGLTTITSMAVSKEEVQATRMLAEMPGSGVRIVSIVEQPVAAEMAEKKDSRGVPLPIEPKCNPTTQPDCRLPRDLGVTGIKVILDGSTQGCSAALQSPVRYQGECSPPEGRLNYTDEQLAKLSEDLQRLWDTNKWRFEFHANGNRALKVALDLFEELQRNQRNEHTATVVHATVGDSELWERAGKLRGEKKAPYLDLRFSHLIGHVAYWGAVFERQLGWTNGRKGSPAEYIDPTSLDKANGIPFTLHSDATVSPSRPLWFVTQAVLRQTWIYPELERIKVIGKGTTVLEALQAVTIRAAEEKELDAWLGSIEVGKVADFVVLSEDPMKYKLRAFDQAKIAGITVVATYLGGEETRPMKLLQ